MNENIKKNINALTPVLITCVYIYKTDPEFKNWKKTVPIALVILLVTYFFVSQVTKTIQKELNAPIDGNLPISADDFDFKTFAKKLYNDITCIFCWRDKQLYRDLAAMPDAYIIAINGYWNDNYFDKLGETLRMSINAEVLGIALEPTLKTINNRFENLKIQ